jgi:hypothetical protein
MPPGLVSVEAMGLAALAHHMAAVESGLRRHACATQHDATRSRPRYAADRKVP